MGRPIIAITMGNAAGVGPEIIMKALSHVTIYERSRPLVIGDAARLRQAGQISGVPLDVRVVEQPSEGAFRHGAVDCIDLALVPQDLPWGRLSAVAGHAAFQYIERAVALAVKGKVDAICTSTQVTLKSWPRSRARPRSR